MELSLLEKVTHDLKQPIDILAGVIAGIKKTDDIKQIHYLCSLADSVYLRARNMISNVHYLAYLEENTPVINNSALSISQYISIFKERTMPYTNMMKVNFETDVNVENDIFICDFEMLSKILDNLVSNAAKYADKEEKNVKLTVSQDGDNYIFSITDNGIGISKEEMPYITECHYRAANARMKTADGSGLGLSLTVQLLDVLGGKMDISSKLNEGSTFTVTVPNGKVTALESPLIEIRNLDDCVLEEIFGILRSK